MSTQISISPIYNIENQEGILVTTPENYSVEDQTLVTNFNVPSTFIPFQNSIEFTMYNSNGDLIKHSANYPDYQIQEEFLEIDYELPFKYMLDGTYISSYNFVQNRLSSNTSQRYYISEISSNRTEIRLDSTDINNEQIISSSLEFIQYRNADEYFPDFYINFGENKLELANNILLDTSTPENPTVLIKLYNPLPEQYDIKSTLYISEFISNPVYVEGVVTRTFEDITPQGIQLQGPNTNLDIKNQVNNSTTFQNINTLKLSTSSSLTNQIDSLLAERGIQISVDYSDYNNFVYLSSAQTRLENFYYKLSLIEDYTVSASYISDPTSSYMSESKAIYDTKINEIITNFDGYEYYLYFESSSTTWPKSNSEPPFVNFTTGSTEGQDWLTGQLATASLYDEFNDNQLVQAIPDYLRDDPANAPLELFVDMLGQNYDSVWVYIKDITNKYNADNRIDYGVSKDLVADIIRDFGVKIYQNNFSLDNLYNAFLGLDPSGSFLLPFDSTNILPVSASSGYEYIETYVTASDVGGVGLDDINKRIYKRLYHNLPMLLKKKGTVEGLRILLRSYGIPDTILQINEFGGKDKINTNDWDYWFKRFNYRLDIDTVNTNHVKTLWSLNSDWASSQPNTVTFRFKTADSASAIEYPSQSLWSIDGEAAVMLEYSGSGFTSASYSGSIVDPDYQYALLHFTPDGTNSASLALPFLNNDWWTVAVTKNSNDYTLYAANKIYSGSDGSSIGFIASASITNASTNWANGELSFFPPTSSLTFGGVPYRPLTGSYQELRYYTTQLNTGSFYDLVMNPQSIEGNYTSASFYQLAFRAPLGGELYTGSTSIHPAVTGSVSATASFASNSDFTINGSFTPNREYVFYDSPAVGIKNRNTDKIKQQNLILPEGDTLSQNISIQQSSFISQSYTNNLNLLEVAFSPQNEINNDIIESLGYFNIGEYIGDPRLISSSDVSYPSLDELRDDYFKKYKDNYNELDFVRLIRFFDNSVFKMIKDFVPSRTSLASGVVIKPHLLERQKYPQPRVYTTSSIAGTENTSTAEEFVNLEITASINSTKGLLDGQTYYSASSDFESNPIVTVEGGAGGSLNKDNIPVAFLRIVNNNAASSYSLTTSPTTILTDNYVVVTTDTGGKGTTLIDNSIETSGDGHFKNILEYDIRGDLKLELTSDTAVRIIAELVEVGSGVVRSVTQGVSALSLPNFDVIQIPTVIFKAGKTYFVRLSTFSGSATIKRIVFGFTQQLDAPSPFRTGQIWDKNVITPSGSIQEVVTGEYEFYDGEFKGSDLTVTTQSLNPENPFLSVNTTPLIYDLDNAISRSNSDPITADTPREEIISLLQARTPSPGNFDVGFVYYPTGSRFVENSDFVLYNGAGSNGGYLRLADTYSDRIIDASVDPDYIFVSASYNGPAIESPFVDTSGNPSTTMNASQGIFVDLINTPGIYTSSGAPYGFNKSFTDTNGIALHFKSALKYELVGINLNVVDKEGIDYTNAIQQSMAYQFDLVNAVSASLTSSVTTKQGSTLLELTRFSTNRDFYALYLTTDVTSVTNLAPTGPTSQFRSTGNTNRELIFTPGENIADIPYNDYNVLLNNYVDARLSTQYEDLDYTQRNLIVPVNINPVISSSADKAPVQDSNYTAARQINSRYKGSKLTSANYNRFTPASSGSQLIRFADGTTGTWTGDKSFGKTPAVNNNANIAFSVEYVNGLYPEIPDATAAQVKDFKIIFDENSSEIIDKSDSLFNFNIDQYLGFSQSLQIFPADNSPVETPNITSLSGDIGAPAKSVYFIQASQSFGQISPTNGVVLSTSSQGIRFASTGSLPDAGVYGGYKLYYQTENKDGEYVQSVSYDSVGSASVFISRSLLEGERWFCTLLTQSVYPLELYEVYNSSSEMEVFNSGGAFNHKEFNPFSLPAFGVYEISEVQYPASLDPGEPTPVVWKFVSGSNVPENRSIGQDALGNYNQGKSLAALIWKSSNVNTPILPVKRPDFFPSGLGDQGGIIYPSSFNARFKTTAVQLKDGIKEIAPGGATIQALPKAVSNTNSSTNPGGSTGGSSNTGGGTPQYPPFGEAGTAGEFREYGGDIYRFGGNGWQKYGRN